MDDYGHIIFLKLRPNIDLGGHYFNEICNDFELKIIGNLRTPGIKIFLML